MSTECKKEHSSSIHSSHGPLSISRRRGPSVARYTSFCRPTPLITRVISRIVALAASGGILPAGLLCPFWELPDRADRISLQITMTFKMQLSGGRKAHFTCCSQAPFEWKPPPIQRVTGSSGQKAEFVFKYLPPVRI